MTLALSSRRAVSDASSALMFRSIRNDTPALPRKTADIVSIGKTKLPPVADYAARCAALIRETFPAPSQHQMCIAAARHTGASIDTVDRILSGLTKSPDARLMLIVMCIRQSRDPRPFHLGGGFAVRITHEGSQ